MKRSFLMGIAIGGCLGACLILMLLIRNTLQARPSDPLTPEVSIAEETTVEESTEFPADQNKTELSEEADAEPEAEEVSKEDLSEELKPAPKEEAALAFAGDVMFSEQYLAAYDQGGIGVLADEEMLTYMQEADLFMLNQEFPFSLRGEAMEDKQYTFCLDPKYVKIFQDLGCDLVTIANNHALDFGQDAFCDTLDTLKEAQISCVGGGYNITEASAPAIRTIAGQTFAIFAATRVSPSYDWYATDSQPGMFQTYDPSRLNEAIKEAEQQYDHTIVFLHWGIERNEFPEDYQRTLAKGYIDAGADLVIGCHPHILQGFEYYNGVPIIYSLGNYLFGNRNDETALLEAVFSKEEPLKVRLIPCKRSDGVLTRIQEPASLYQHLNELSFDVQVQEDGVLQAL